MAQSYHYKTLIDSRDVDGRGQCRASALLGHMQEAATQAAEHGGFGRGIIMGQHNGFWMLTRMWYRVSRPLRWRKAKSSGITKDTEDSMHLCNCSLIRSISKPCSFSATAFFAK